MSWEPATLFRNTRMVYRTLSNPERLTKERVRYSLPCQAAEFRFGGSSTLVVPAGTDVVVYHFPVVGGMDETGPRTDYRAAYELLDKAVVAPLGRFNERPVPQSRKTCAQGGTSGGSMACSPLLIRQA